MKKNRSQKKDRSQKSEVRRQKMPGILHSSSFDSHPSSFILHPSARRGSILILVIALLVMLALIGTAFISTTRIDRAAAAQGTANTETDLFSNSVQNLAVNAIVNDMFTTGGLQKPEVYPFTANPFIGYNAVTSPVTSTFLASRVPTGTSALPMWEWISGPLSGGVFEDPTTLATWGGPATTDRYHATVSFTGSNLPALVTASAGKVVAGDADGDGIADCGLVRLGALPGPQFSGVTFYYGVRVIDGNSAVNANTAWTSNNDGDITAGAATQAGPSGMIRNNRLTPASIGLREMLSTSSVSTPSTDEFDFPTTLPPPQSLQLYRFGGSTTNTSNDPGTVASQPPLADYSPTAPATITPTQRRDFAFTSQFDAFWTQLGSRLDYPGYASIPALGGVPATRFQALPMTDTASLAYRFCLVNPSVNSAVSTNPSGAFSTAPSVVERTLHNELYNIPYNPSTTAPPLSANTPAPVPYASYSPNQFANWFNYNFSYKGGAADMPLRALLVTRNPVLNIAPFHTVAPVAPFLDTYSVTTTPEYMTNGALATAPTTGAYVDRGAWASGTTYAQGDLVYYADSAPASGTPTDSRAYVSLTSGNLGKIPDANTPNWRVQQWNATPAKINANTASFEDLWRGYWNVMVNDPSNAANASPFDPPTTVVDGSLTYYGNEITGVYQSHPERMFRSVYRDPVATAGDPFLSSQDMVLIRSAIAAANAEHMRDFSQSAGQNPRTETLKVHTLLLKNNASTAFAGTLQADIFPSGMQPFITEVYVSRDIEWGTSDAERTIGPPGIPDRNPDGYIAVELYNPFNYDIDIQNWRLVLHQRNGAAGKWDNTPAGTVTGWPITFPAGTIIKAHGYLLLENYNPAAPVGARYRPTATGLPPTGDLSTTSHTTPNQLSVVVENDLSRARTYEMALLRPAILTQQASGAFANTTAGVATEVPVDSFDFTNIAPGKVLTNRLPPPNNYPTATSVAAEAFEYYYCRPSGAANPWQCVYPGHYQQGGALNQEMVANSWVPAVYDATVPTTNETNVNDPWIGGINTTDPTKTNISPGGNPGNTYNPTLGFNTASTPTTNDNTISTTAKTFAIQLGGGGTSNVSTVSGFGGPNGLHTYAAGSPEKAPFGNFMREGDLLQIPFIGSYVIYDKAALVPAAAPDGGAVSTTAQALYEVNSVSMDSAFADDTDQADDFEENIGRFCPIIRPTTIGTIDESGATGIANVRYGWATRLFDYLTVTSGQHSPDVAQSTYLTLAGSTATDPQAVPHSSGSAKNNPVVQGDEPPTVEGRVNINTAPYPVLVAIPWASPSNPNAAAINKLIADSIITYRNTNATTLFHNIFELNKIPSFRTNQNDTNPTAPWGKWGTETNGAAAFTAASGTAWKIASNGDFSPMTPANFPGTLAAGSFTNDTSDGVINDFESQFLQLTSVSNLITTRSDTFTVYIVIEGWTNVGTTAAQRVSQRRVAFLVDRTGVTSTNNRVVKITPVPAD
jgi:hypothetical protein